MPEYLTKKTSLGKIGISSQAVLSVCKITAREDERVEVDEKHSKCRFYGNHVKVELLISIKDEYVESVDPIKICQDLQDDIIFDITEQIGLKDLDVKVYIHPHH